MSSVARRSIPRSLASVRQFAAAARRRRPTAVSTKFEKALEKQQQELRLTQPDRGGLHQAFAPTEANFDDYLSKASLSPWVPVPDPVARKMLEISKAGPDDVRTHKSLKAHYWFFFLSPFSSFTILSKLTIDFLLLHLKGSC